jgi:hypothetical protein
MLSGCGAKLPDCSGPLKEPPKKQRGIAPAAAVGTTPGSGTDVLIGIDGSGSMLGFAQAADKSSWTSLLQSVSQGVLLKGLKPSMYRVGGGITEGPVAGTLSKKAVDPCFYKGCDGFAPVASSLDSLWKVDIGSKLLPLRLLISDLEVNQSDISSLLTGIKKDLAKGASAGVLAMRAPFTGDVYDAEGKVIARGNTERPVYILATGPEEQVRSALVKIKKTLALKGITNTEYTLIDGSSTSETLKAQSISGIPATKASPGLPVRIDGKTFSRSGNPGYQFIRLDAGARGLELATTKMMPSGSARPNIEIADIENISVTNGKTEPAEGMDISRVEINGRNIRLSINVDKIAPSGIYRAVIPPGSMPKQWWLDWDRRKEDTTKPGRKTQGLLALLIGLGQEIAATTNAPPAAILCFALQN